MSDEWYNRNINPGRPGHMRWQSHSKGQEVCGVHRKKATVKTVLGVICTTLTSHTKEISHASYCFCSSTGQVESTVISSGKISLRYSHVHIYLFVPCVIFGNINLIPSGFIKQPCCYLSYFFYIWPFPSYPVESSPKVPFPTRQTSTLPYYILNLITVPRG